MTGSPLSPKMSHAAKTMEAAMSKAYSTNKEVPEQGAFNFTVSLNGNMAKYGPDIRRFIDAMVYKLEKNAHKGRWEDLSMPQAFDRLQDEVKELLAEVNSDRNTIKVTLEAADVANFALIIAAMAIEGRK